ncbi:hypothetical protein SAMN05720762_104129 [Fibrobacter sp. UWH4]|nr:hypothetical protein SAMN05720762_104129 [Fibrobacter sp. UWH4]
MSSKRSLGNKSFFNAIFTKNKYIMVNQPRFNKTVDEIVDPVDVWLYVLKHANGKLTDEEISDMSEIPLEEIKKRRALRERGL